MHVTDPLANPRRTSSPHGAGSPVDHFGLASDRRNSQRFVPIEDQAWLGWWEGEEYRKTPATIIDLSQGGSKLVVRDSPPRRSAAFVCLAGPNRTDWIQGGVLEVRRLSSGESEVRIAFVELCPYSFFEVAILGTQSARKTSD